MSTNIQEPLHWQRPEERVLPAMLTEQSWCDVQLHRPRVVRLRAAGT
jgi:hypothetical protein